MLIFSAIVNAKIANFIAASVKLVHFIAILCVCGSPSRIFSSFLLDCEMKIKHFTAVTSVLQILFVMCVMFRVYVYWSGSDTYPVFRTRFSPTVIDALIAGI